MANTFTLKSKSYDGRYLELTLKQTKNVSANTSSISWTLTAVGGGSNYYSTGPTTAKIGSTQLCYYPRKSYSTHEFPAGPVGASKSGSVTVSHNADGSCVLPVSLSTAIYSSSLSTVSGTWALDTIPRASAATATSGNIGQSILIAISRGSSAFTHSLRYSFGSLSGWIGTGGGISSSEVKHGGTSVTFTLPESFYAQIPEDPSGTGTITCYTYSGSTLLGTSDCSFTAYAEQSVCAPIVSATAVDCNEETLALTGDENVLVRYKSTVCCTITAVAQKGASLTRKKIGTVTVGEDNVRNIQRIETGQILFSAKDSRGYETTVTLEKPMIPYIKLTNNATVRRLEPTGDEAEIHLRGSCYCGSFGLGENTLVARYHIGSRDTVEIPVPIRSDHTYDLTFTLSGFPYGEDSKFYVTMRDALSDAQKTIPVSRGMPVFDWGESDFQFHVPVGFDQSVSGAYIRPVRVWGTNAFRLHSKHTVFSGDGWGGDRQSVFLFGSMDATPCMGVIRINGAGGCAWSGTEGVVLTAEEDGVVRVTLKTTCHDYFVLISAEPISIL